MRSFRYDYHPEAKPEDLAFPTPRHHEMLGIAQHDIKAVLRIAAAIACLFVASSARAEKIRTAIPQANLNYLSIYTADAKGFFRDEGLDNETVVISGPLSIAALLSGDIDYSGALHRISTRCYTTILPGFARSRALRANARSIRVSIAPAINCGTPRWW